MRIHIFGCCLWCIALLSSFSMAQTTPFLTDDEIEMLVNEISGDRAFEHVRWLSHWHRDSGMEGFFKAADYVVQAAEEAGLEDVKFIKQEKRGRNYTAKSGELWMVEPVELKLADIGEHAVYLADGSHDADTIAELVWIGDGSKESLKEIEVAGKIVLTSGSASAAAYNAVWGKGAIGVVSFSTTEGRSPMDFPDQIAWTRIPVNPPEGKKGTFAFSLPPRKGDALRKILETDKMQDYLATGKKSKGGRVLLKVKVDTEIGPEPGRTGFVEAWIRGTKHKDQQIVLTAHLQEEQGSANDDGSGCGNILEFGRAYMKLIREGKVARPLRDIRFWWADEIYSEYRYFEDNPDEPKKMLANIHQDMVGAKQSMGSRVQHLIFAPASRTSFLDALFESVGTYVIRTNNAYLSASRAGGLPRPHTRPIYATRGTREGYNAAFVPYFGQSDYMVFLEGIIGVPAVGLINWDDYYIHSSDDDLFQIDQTQLRRNCFIVGAMAHVLARVEPSATLLFASETYAQALKRLADDTQVAMEVIRDKSRSVNERWSDASMMIEQGIERELRAMNSIRVLAESDAGAHAVLDGLVARLNAKRLELEIDLSTLWRHVNGSSPPHIELSESALDASKKIPRNIESVKKYFAARNKSAVRTGLHSLMRDAVFNFVDGQRSYYDIYKAVRAEAMAAGAWYYGTVSLDDVARLLDNAVEGGVLLLR